MDFPVATPESFERHLAVLGLSARPPGLDALHELVDAQVTRVPFENLSKLCFRGDPGMRLPPLERWLDGIEARGLGGTCYANNHHLVQLLRHLGYAVRLCGAEMSRPDVHVVGVVTLAGREYLVDAGYAAPFHAPMPLDPANETEVSLGDDRWVLRPRGAHGRPRLDQFHGGLPRHGYTLNPAPRRIQEFAGVIEESFAPTAVFMNALVIARFTRGRSRVLHNFTLIDSEGTSSTRREIAATPTALPQAIEEHFGIPADFAGEALVGITLTQDAWS